jgi:hypothetical protein
MASPFTIGGWRVRVEGGGGQSKNIDMHQTEQCSERGAGEVKVFWNSSLDKKI